MPEDGVLTQQPVVLWWGRSDVGYSRNEIIRHSFESLGWRIRDFRPWVSRLGHWQAALGGLPRDARAATLLWVPCFRQRDIAAARAWASRLNIALCIDPLISAFDKQVDERGKYAPHSRQAQRLQRWESQLFAAADRVVADTTEHADYFARELGVDSRRTIVIPVGADESMFLSTPLPSLTDPVQVLFYGSFLALQGPQFIVQAASRVQSANVRITMLGDGPLHAQCVQAAKSANRVHFEPWTDYRRLPARIAQAHVLLGVFGSTPKAARVIPNKVYQSLASARPVITRDASAYPAALREDGGEGLRFVAPGDADAIAQAIDDFASNAQRLPLAGESARQTYVRWFGAQRVRSALAELLTGLGLPALKAQ